MSSEHAETVVEKAINKIKEFFGAPADEDRTEQPTRNTRTLRKTPSLTTRCASTEPTTTA